MMIDYIKDEIQIPLSVAFRSFNSDIKLKKEMTL